MSTLSAEEMAMFNTDVSDDWGFDDAPAAPAPNRLNFTDQSTRSDAEVKAERDRIAAAVQANGGKIPPTGARMSDVDAAMSQLNVDSVRAALEPAAIIPPDAPANSADVPPPEKAKRGKKAASQAIPQGVVVPYEPGRILAELAEIKALLLSLVAR